MIDVAIETAKAVARIKDNIIADCEKTIRILQDDKEHLREQNSELLEIIKALRGDK